MAMENIIGSCKKEENFEVKGDVMEFKEEQPIPEPFFILIPGLKTEQEVPDENPLSVKIKEENDEKQPTSKPLLTSVPVMGGLKTELEVTVSASCRMNE
ncbi:hypothetical protein C0J52_13275 [Blattella germanica]|nr:hypothetical protein C0J52_13275 [Blattella germanica]